VGCDAEIWKVSRGASGGISGTDVPKSSLGAEKDGHDGSARGRGAGQTYLKNLIGGREEVRRNNDGADWTCHREGLGATGKVRGGALPQQDSAKEHCHNKRRTGSRAVYEGESQVARRKGRRPWSSCHVVGQMYRTCKVSNRACTVNRSSDTAFRLRV
jgi:hypothetical protein